MATREQDLRRRIEERIRRAGQQPGQPAAPNDLRGRIERRMATSQTRQQGPPEPAETEAPTPGFLQRAAGAVRDAVTPDPESRERQAQIREQFRADRGSRVEGPTGSRETSPPSGRGRRGWGEFVTERLLPDHAPEAVFPSRPQPRGPAEGPPTQMAPEPPARRDPSRARTRGMLQGPEQPEPEAPISTRAGRAMAFRDHPVQAELETEAVDRLAPGGERHYLDERAIHQARTHALRISRGSLDSIVDADTGEERAVTPEDRRLAGFVYQSLGSRQQLEEFRQGGLNRFLQRLTHGQWSGSAAAQIEEARRHGRLTTPEDLEEIGFRTDEGERLRTDPTFTEALREGLPEAGADLAYMALGAEGALLRGAGRAVAGRGAGRFGRELERIGQLRAPTARTTAGRVAQRARTGAAFGAGTSATLDVTQAFAEGRNPVVDAALGTVMGGALGAGLEIAAGSVLDVVRRRGLAHAAARVLGNDAVARAAQANRGNPTGFVEDLLRQARMSETARLDQLPERGVRSAEQLGFSADPTDRVGRRARASFARTQDRERHSLLADLAEGLEGALHGRTATETPEVRPGSPGGARPTARSGGAGAARPEGVVGAEPVPGAAAAPEVVITGQEFGTASLSTARIRDRARDFARNELRGKHFGNRHTGWEIIISGTGLRKTFSHAAKREHVQSITALPRLLEDARLVATEANRNPREAASTPWVHTFEAQLRIGDVSYRVKMLVKEAKDGRRFYDHDLTRIDPDATSAGALPDPMSGGAAPRATGPTSETIADPAPPGKPGTGGPRALAGAPLLLAASEAEASQGEGEDAGPSLAKTGALLAGGAAVGGAAVAIAARRAGRRTGAVERRALERELMTDKLTGVANRRALDDALPTAERDRNTSVLVFDGDNFGQVNKVAGQKEGDRVIQELAESVKVAADEQGLGQRVFRRGGDEFVVLAPRDRADQVLRDATELFGTRDYSGVEVSLTGRAAATFDEADRALMAAKEQRRRGPASPPPSEPPRAGRPPTPGDIDPSDHANIAKFNLDPGGENRLRTEVARVVETHGAEHKRPVTWDETRQRAAEIGLEPEQILKKSATRLSGAEMLAIRNIVKQNIEMVDRLTRAGSDGTLPAERMTQIEELIAGAETQNQALLSRFVAARSEAGRNLNSLKILANSTMDDVTWIARAQRQANRPLTIEEQAAIQRLINQGDRNALAQHVANLKPVLLREQLAALFKANILSAPVSHVTNYVGNITWRATEIAVSPVALGFDRALSLITGVETRAPNVGDIARSAVKGAVQGSREGAAIMRGRLPTTPSMKKWDAYREVDFDSWGAAGPFLNAWTRTVFRSLSAEDRPMRIMGTMQSLHEQARVLGRKEGLRGGALDARVKEIVKDPPDEMLLRAIEAGEVAVFAERGTLARVAAKAKGSARETPGARAAAAFLALEVTAPFTRVPANLLTRGLEFTPIVGHAMGLADVAKLVTLSRRAATEAEITAVQRKAADTLGRATFGTAAIALGYWLHQQGWLSLGFPSNQSEREQWQLEGKAPMSIRVGNQWRSLQKFAPLGTTVVVGGYLHEAMSNPEASKADVPLALGAAAASTVAEQPFLQGMQRLQEGLDDPARRGARAGQDVLASFLVPNLLRRGARVVDTTVREPEGAWEVIQSRVPGLSLRVPARLDQFGREVEGERGVWTNLFDITYPRTDRADQDPVIRALRDSGVNLTRRRRGQDESREDHRERIRQEGERLHAVLHDLVAQPAFVDLNEEHQGLALRQTINTMRSRETRARR